ncbi:class II glutamine amidotransferase [Paraburkholderia aspalathi]|uniref:class II glutamine amidotransferase n=1 Tax=Paraburkholderia aspalathi TaxID=1324617 RepID=UPI0038B70913
MCQLLALSCAEPTDVTFSFTGFAARGGLTDHHVDGWGIAFYEERACRLFIDNKPACRSPMAEFVKRYPIKSRNVIAHIRKATQGGASAENCHPFMREHNGQQWVFAHNGDLRERNWWVSGPYAPVGTTDSETAFCTIMNVIHKRGVDRDTTPDELFDVIEDITRDLNQYGIFNFLLSNGQSQFAYCSTRLAYVMRRWPFSSARLVDADMSVDFSAYATSEDYTAVIATTPLTDEAWTTCQPGDLLMFRAGSLVRRAHVPVPPQVLATARYAPSETSGTPVVSME